MAQFLLYFTKQYQVTQCMLKYGCSHTADVQTSGLSSLWRDQCDFRWHLGQVSKRVFISCIALCHAKKAAFLDRCLTAAQLSADLCQAVGSQEIYDILFIDSPLIIDSLLGAYMKQLSQNTQ